MNTRMNLLFVKPSAYAIRGASAWSWLLLALAAVFTLLTIQHFNAVKTRLNQSEEKLNEVVALQPKKVLDDKRLSEMLMLPKHEVSLIRKTVEQLVIPWDALFASFESTQSRSIALLELSPSQQKEIVVIRGEGKNLEAVFAYIRALDQLPTLDKVHLQSHHVDKADADLPVVFTLHAHWKVGA